MKTKKAITEFLEAKHDRSPRTLEQYSQALDYLEREFPKMPKKPQPIRSALNKITSEWVRDVHWRVWRVFFRWCHSEYGSPDCMVRVERPRRPEQETMVLTPEEMPVVLAAAKNLQEKAVIALALDSGIRASEFGHLRISDIDTDIIWVWGKGRKRRWVPLNPETRHLLQLLIDQDGSRGNNAPIFVGHDGQGMSRFAVYRIVRQCMDRAGVSGPKRGPHRLRHSLATDYLARGGNLFTLQKVMRHSRLDTTRRYVKLVARNVVEQHRQYSPVRDALRGAQGVLWEKEVEEILEGK